MKIEAVSKMDDSFTICDYKREQPKDIWPSLERKWNKEHGIKDMVIGADIYQNARIKISKALRK